MVAGREEDRKWTSDDLNGGPAEGRFSAVIEEDDFLLLVHRYDGVHGYGRYSSRLLLRRAQLRHHGLERFAVPRDRAQRNHRGDDGDRGETSGHDLRAGEPASLDGVERLDGHQHGAGSNSQEERPAGAMPRRGLGGHELAWTRHDPTLSPAPPLHQAGTPQKIRRLM